MLLSIKEKNRCVWDDKRTRFAVIDEVKITREENKYLRKELEIMEKKVDLAVEYMQTEQTTNKGGFFKSLFKIK